MTTPTTEQVTEPTSYDLIGGGAAVRLAVDNLYTNILTDPELSGYFIGKDVPNIKRHMAEVFTMVLGGPATYDVSKLGSVHATVTRPGRYGEEPITRAAYRRVVIHVAGVLYGLRVPMNIIMAVGEVLASLETAIVPGPAVD